MIFLEVPEAETVKQQQLIARGRKYGAEANDISLEYLQVRRTVRPLQTWRRSTPPLPTQRRQWRHTAVALP